MVYITNYICWQIVLDKIIGHLLIMPYVEYFLQNFLLPYWSLSYFPVHTCHTLLHDPHGANAGCDLAGLTPVIPDVTALPGKTTASEAGISFPAFGCSVTSFSK